MKLAIATNNQHKLTEIKAILGNSFEELLSLKDLGIDVDVEETGTTLEENSLLKARTICELCNMPTLADDTGLWLTRLDGAPGVYSARYAGEAHNDKANRQLLLKNLEGVAKSSRPFCDGYNNLLSKRRLYHRKRTCRRLDFARRTGYGRLRIRLFGFSATSFKKLLRKRPQTKKIQ